MSLIMFDGLKSIEGGAVAAVNPNYHCGQGGIYYSLSEFHQSKRPILSVSAEQASLFELLKLRISVNELRCNWSHQEKFLKQCFDSKVLHFVRRSQKKKGKHVVIIEPHIDDVVLSVAGLLLQLPHDCHVTIVTNIYLSDFTSYHMKTAGKVDFVTQRRLEEAQLACQLLGADHKHLGQVDLPMRHFGQEADLFEGDDLQGLADRLFECVSSMEPDELWFPLASGAHSDHHNTRNAAIRMLQQNWQSYTKCKVFVYEDQPYVFEYPESVRDALLNNILGDKPWRSNVKDTTDVVVQKHRLMSVFSSQFKVESIEPEINEAAKCISSEYDFAERLWAVDRPPGSVRYRDFVLDCDVNFLVDQFKDNKSWKFFIYGGFYPAYLCQLFDWFGPERLDLHVNCPEILENWELPDCTNVYVIKDDFEVFSEEVHKSSGFSLVVHAEIFDIEVREAFRLGSQRLGASWLYD